MWQLKTRLYARSCEILIIIRFKVKKDLLPIPPNITKSNGYRNLKLQARTYSWTTAEIKNTDIAAAFRDFVPPKT